MVSFQFLIKTSTRTYLSHILDTCISSRNPVPGNQKSQVGWIHVQRTIGLGYTCKVNCSKLYLCVLNQLQTYLIGTDSFPGIESRESSVCDDECDSISSLISSLSTGSTILGSVTLVDSLPKPKPHKIFQFLK